MKTDLQNIKLPTTGSEVKFTEDVATDTPQQYYNFIALEIRKSKVPSEALLEISCLNKDNEVHYIVIDIASHKLSFIEKKDSQKLNLKGLAQLQNVYNPLWVKIKTESEETFPSILTYTIITKNSS